MCGIAGIASFNQKVIPSMAIERMTAALSHRGPDGQGLYFDDHIALGHRRLSIIDLSSAGKQPMSVGSKTITYNGEIYNFREIRSDLSKLGWTFRSQTDTEVVLSAFCQWG